MSRMDQATFENLLVRAKGNPQIAAHIPLNKCEGCKRPTEQVEWCEGCKSWLCGNCADDHAKQEG